jgi:hypothetical protein
LGYILAVEFHTGDVDLVILSKVGEEFFANGRAESSRGVIDKCRLFAGEVE